jgi:hypothetical protein
MLGPQPPSDGPETWLGLQHGDDFISASLSPAMAARGSDSAQSRSISDWVVAAGEAVGKIVNVGC